MNKLKIKKKQKKECVRFMKTMRRKGVLGMDPEDKGEVFE
jgi:hypothetical protein